MATITIQRYTTAIQKVDRVPVKATIVGPFGVHRDIGDYGASKAPWNVTHVGTGLVACKRNTRRTAIQAAERLAGLDVDWTSADVAKGRFTKSENAAIHAALWIDAGR